MPFTEMLSFIGIGAFGVFISSVAQILLKKEALKEHDSFLQEYLNPLVISGYVLMLISTLLLVIAFKGIPLSMGPILEATSYLYVTVFGVVLFKEQLGKKKIAALGVIMLGIVVYSMGL